MHTSSFFERVRERYNKTPSQEQLRKIQRDIMEANPLHPNLSDLKDFGCAAAIKFFEPITLAICTGKELTCIVRERINRKVTGL